MIKIIDRYITRKFLGTFFYSIALIVAIAIVFDISEKIDDFIDKQAPLHAIVFDYYLNFIPYFANLFSPLFVFISVIFFTSRLAGNSEMIAMLSSGMSFRRLLLPYLASAFIIAGLSFYLNNWVIPHSNQTRLEFDNRYVRNPFIFRYRNIHRQLEPGNFIYFESYNNSENIGFQFSNERFENGKLVYKLLADRIAWDSTRNKWRLENYFARHIDGMYERMDQGAIKDTSYRFLPGEFQRRENNIETMDTPELIRYISDEKQRGLENTSYMEVEQHRRTSFPFATFILTVIGVSLSSRKIKGGMGLQLGMGVFLSFAYIMLMQISSTFAIKASFPPLIAVWIPNLVFAGVALILYRKAQT